MVLHELAANAAKHGSLKSYGGRLKVAWRQEADASGARKLHVAWEETATHPAQPLNGPGYGTVLIDTTIGSLGGVVERLPCEKGFSVRISVPF